MAKKEKRKFSEQDSLFVSVSIMAEPVEDDVSLLGPQEATEHNLEYTAEASGTTKDYRSALRPPPLTPQSRQERKAMTAG